MRRSAVATSAPPAARFFCLFYFLFCFFVCESGRFSWIFRMKPVFIVTAFMCTYVLLDESPNVLSSDV